MKRLFTVIPYCVILCSCAEKTETPSIFVDLNGVEELVIDTCRLTQLESSDSSLVYDINSLERTDDRLIVHSRDLLRSYDRNNGHFTGNIAVHGKEYKDFSYIGNFWLEGDTIRFFDTNLGAVLSYTESGEYLGRTKPLGDSFRDGEKPRQYFTLPNEGVFTVNISTDHTTKENPRFTFYPKGSTHGTAVGGRDVKEQTWLPDGVFVDTINSRLLSWEPLRDTIFEVTTEFVRPLYVVDFGGNALPDAVKKKPYLAERIAEFNKKQDKPYASLIRYVQMVDDKMYFSFATGDGKAYLTSYNCNSGATSIKHLATPDGKFSQSTFFKIIGDSAVIEIRNRKNDLVNPAIYSIALTDLQ